MDIEKQHQEMRENEICIRVFHIFISGHLHTLLCIKLCIDLQIERSYI